jgi:hypothetical protein
MMVVIMFTIFLKKDKIILIFQILLNGIKFGLVKEYGIAILYLNNGCKFLEVIIITIKFINLLVHLIKTY